MAILPFYDNKTINDTNKTLNSVIVSVCKENGVDWNYEYANPCELLEKCYPPQLTNQAMIDFLNLAPTGQYLGTDAGGNPTWWNVTYASTDRMAKVVSTSASTRYLGTAFASTANISINTEGDRIIRVSTPDTANQFIRYGGNGAACSEGLLMIDSNGSVFTSCDIADWMDLVYRIRNLTNQAQGLADVNDKQDDQTDDLYAWYNRLDTSVSTGGSAYGILSTISHDSFVYVKANSTIYESTSAGWDIGTSASRISGSSSTGDITANTTGTLTIRTAGIYFINYQC
jgi:hypothetical protein